MLGLVILNEDQDNDANLLIISIDIKTKKEVILTKKPATAGEKNAVRRKSMAMASVNVPRRGTAIKLAIIVTAETRLK